MKVERINESAEVNITRTDVLEFPNGGNPIVLNVEYKDGKLVTSSKTNKENIPEFEIEYDKDFDFDWNLDVLYNVIIKEHPEYLEMKGMKEAYREQPNEREVEELSIYIGNDSDTYRYHTIPTVKSLARKKIKGVYDKDLAVKAFEYVAKAGADKYKKEFADDYEQFTFNPATRHETAKLLLDNYESIINDYVEHPEDLKESIIDKNNVEDQVMVDINKPGFLSKMEELRKNGYKRLWGGDGKVCFAKPKKMEKSIGLKEDYSETDIRSAIFKVHGIMEDTYTNVLANIVSRALDSGEEDTYDAVVDAVDTGLIYYNDEWAVIEHYTSPKDINDNTYSEAVDNLIDDAVKVIEFIKKNNIDESLDKDVMVNQELNAPKESVESQCPAYAGAMKEMSKAQDERVRKVETDIKNVTNKDFNIEDVEKYELDESLLN